MFRVSTKAPRCMWIVSPHPLVGMEYNEQPLLFSMHRMTLGLRVVRCCQLKACSNTLIQVRVTTTGDVSGMGDSCGCHVLRLDLFADSGGVHHHRCDLEQTSWLETAQPVADLFPGDGDPQRLQVRNARQARGGLRFSRAGAAALT